ncbi:MAG: hypothetical protein VX800_02245 [Chloroflexota bacterium]|mgnify:FL=1|nr:hypothetical protein [Chloroflexota bacterium]
MVRGRNSIVIGVRIPDTLHAVLKAVTEEKGSTISEYVGNILKRHYELTDRMDESWSAKDEL